MKWHVSIRGRAEADLADAKRWYDQQRAGLGSEFLASIADAMLRMEEFPEIYPFYYRDYRRVIATRFPYKIFFRVEGNSIIVFRVLHVAQDHTRVLSTH